MRTAASTPIPRMYADLDFRHRRYCCHPERSEGPMQSAGGNLHDIGPSRKGRAQDDKRNPRESAEKKSPRSCG